MATELATQNMSLTFLKLEEYNELKEAMISAYRTMPGAYWREHQIRTLIERFPEGQIVVKVNGEIAGCALSIIVDSKKFEEHHTYREITGD